MSFWFGVIVGILSMYTIYKVKENLTIKCSEYDPELAEIIRKSTPVEIQSK